MWPEWIILLVALYAPGGSPPATFDQRWPDPFHEFGVLPYPAPFRGDAPRSNKYAIGNDGWISGRCGIAFHRTLCIWDEARI